MMTTVVPFNGISYLPIPREQILQGALNSLDDLGPDVLVISYLGNGELWISGSTAEVGTILLMLEQAKRFVVENAVIKGKGGRDPAGE